MLAYVNFALKGSIPLKKPLLLILAALLLSGCTGGGPPAQGSPPAQGTAPVEGLVVTATLFPQFDFARAVAGELADVRLLLPPGVESHSYEPSPQDIIAINGSQVFLYTGPYMEPWAADIAQSLASGVAVVDVSAGLTLDEVAEAHGHGGRHYDPHIWTDPAMAMAMVDNIAAAFAQADPANATAYAANASAYKAELQALDDGFREAVAAGSRRTICFGGRFALHYFAKRYGLTCIAAYDSCSEETEPSARAVARIMDAIRQEGIPVIYYEELVEPKVALSIAKETGAKALLLHSCHNVSAKELQDGVTYLSLMRQNLANLKEGLA